MGSLGHLEDQYLCICTPQTFLQGWVGEEAAGSRVEEVVWGGGVCQLWLAVRVSMSFTIFGGLPAGTSGPVKADCRLLAPRSPTG